MVNTELRVTIRSLAESFFKILYPLSHWLSFNPANSMEIEHIERLNKIIMDSLRLARELRARRETYVYVWPRPRDQFDPIIHVHVDDTDVDAESQAERGRARSGEVIAFTLMCGVRVSRGMSDDESPMVYAKAIVTTMHP